MFIRPLFIILLATLFSVRANAQKILLHSAGVSAQTVHATIHGAGKQGQFTITHAHLTYFPRVQFPFANASSISLGMPLSIGYGFVGENFMKLSGNYMSYDLPFVLDYNFGFTAEEPGDNKFGFYFGAGYGITFSRIDSIGKTNNKANSGGLILRGGVRFGFPESEKNRGFTLGLFHKTGFETENYKTTGITALIDF